MNGTLSLSHPALAYWRKRDANKQLTDKTINEAISAACQWAEENAPNASEFVKTSIAILFVQFCYETDPGERLLLRDAISLYLEIAP